jgi:hypothetical protein
MLRKPGRLATSERLARVGGGFFLRGLARWPAPDLPFLVVVFRFFVVVRAAAIS